MDYIEVLIDLEQNKHIAEDIVIAYLSVQDFESFCTEGNILSAYIQEDNYNEDTFIALMRKEKIVDYKINFIKRQNWNEQWEKSFQPVNVDNKCIVRADFHEPQPKIEYDIIINPKMSFGTGHHETTYLMVQSMLDLDFEGKSVADCGCGTGVLAIFAAMKGAEFVFAFDIDDWAIENTIENIRVNNISELKADVGGVELLEGLEFDILLANINKNILLASMDYFVNALKPGGAILFSGIYEHDIADLKACACGKGLKFVSFSENNKWVCCTFVK